MQVTIRQVICGIILCLNFCCFAKSAEARDQPWQILALPASSATLNVTVALPDDLELSANEAWQLVEVGLPENSVTIQQIAVPTNEGLRSDAKQALAIAIPPRKGSDHSRRFAFKRLATPATSVDDMKFQELSNRTLAILEGTRPVLAYNYGVIWNNCVPESDPRRQRACYIHPLWGLNGEIITDDFPKDHWHHHGVFWTWPYITIDGEKYDTWFDTGKIQQRFVRWLCREAGPVSAVLAVENGWFVGDRKVMIERVWIRPFVACDGGQAIDLEFFWIPVDRAITLQGTEEKSYGGLTVRLAPSSRDETKITIPSGLTNDDLLNTPLTWVDMTSKFSGSSSPSGMALFVSPDHPDFPPTWLTRYYGPLCVGWPGVRAQTFQPGEIIHLKYRLWIHQSKLQPSDIARAYEAYKESSLVTWQ